MVRGAISRAPGQLLLGLACLWCLAAHSGCFLPGVGPVATPAARGARLPLAKVSPYSSQRQLSVQRHFFDDLFKGEEKKPDIVVINEDYTLAGVFGALGVLLCAALPFAGFGIGAFILLLGVLFFVQAGRVRFVFDDDSFSLRTMKDGEDLSDPGQNIVVGGENRWKYTSFVNYEFFPKGLVEQGLPPVLVYFKEVQTPKEEWSVGPGELANSEDAVAKGAVPGMVHFFPAICDAQQIKAEFERRGCKKIS